MLMISICMLGYYMYQCKSQVMGTQTLLSVLQMKELTYYIFNRHTSLCTHTSLSLVDQFVASDLFPC